MKILAGIVLYNPEMERLIQNVSAVKKQVNYIILVDNASENIEEIRQYVMSTGEIFLIENSNNLGIAYALNQIMKYSYDHFYDWVLTLDQDSVCQNNLITEYIQHVGTDKVAMFTPLIKDRNFDSELDIKSDTDYVDKCITSASLCKVDAWKKVGGYDEWMFIDYVDFDFCAKLIIAGYKILRVNTTVLLHELGNGKRYKLLFKSPIVCNHNSVRKYYYTRNLLYFAYNYGQYYNKKKLYIILLKSFISMIIYENDKLDKLKATFHGYLDYKKKIKELN